MVSRVLTLTEAFVCMHEKCVLYIRYQKNGLKLLLLYQKEIYGKHFNQ